MRKIKITKKKVWAVFSKYQRLRYADEEGMVQTWDFSGQILGLKFPWQGTRQVNGGHFFPKRYAPNLYFDECNVHPQYAYENKVGEGSQFWHGNKIIEVHGIDEMNRMIEEVKEYKKWKRKNIKKSFVWKKTTLESLFEEYSEKLKSLKIERNME